MVIERLSRELRGTLGRVWERMVVVFGLVRVDFLSQIVL